MTDPAPDPTPAPSGPFVTLKQNMTVAQVLLDYLALEGVTKIFGIPGGAVIYLLNELRKRRDEFDFIVCRHETGAAYIAHGYARVTGGLGVVITTSGPSATNAVTGAMNAEADHCSVLLITGEVPQADFDKGYLQEGIDARLDVSGIYKNAVKSSAVVSNQSNFATLFEQALRNARSVPPSAAHIGLPNDIAGTCVTGSDKNHPYQFAFPASVDQYRTVPSGTDDERARFTITELWNATRPLVFLGDGARDALRDPGRLMRFTNFVEKFALPVMTTPDAKGIFPESHPLSLRNYGMAACTWPVLYMKPPADPDHYDALLVLGSSLGELATSPMALDQYSTFLKPSSHFIHVDPDQSVIGREFLITRGIVGDIGLTMDALWEIGQPMAPDRMKTEARRQIVADIKATMPSSMSPEYRASNASPNNPAALMRVINETVTAGHIFIDAGNCVGWSLNQLVIDPPLQYHAALAMGPMGFAVGAVIGGKLGAPGEICLAIVGDGAFMMHGAEISTAAQHGIGAIFVVLNDNDLGMVSQGMAFLFPPNAPWNHYYALGAPDLVKFSEGLGAQAVAITKDQGPAEFAAALSTAIRQAGENRPQVIVVDIDTTVMPPYFWPILPPAPCQQNASDGT